MQKLESIDIADSNIAFLGSQLETDTKKAAAETEPAWIGAGEDVGIEIWRINDFKVEFWPKDQYGAFYDGDSYIILNTYKTEGQDDLKYDVHFWIGKDSTQDEYGTAAYKTVELDDYLDDKPIQHRETEGYESVLFKSYFPTLTLLKGGVDSGFNHVEPETYEPRLFHVKKHSKKSITCTQVGLYKSNLDSDDVFIIDNGNIIYQWNGKECTPDEKFKAAQEVAKLKSKRGKAHSSVIEEYDCPSSHPMFALLKDGEPEDLSETSDLHCDILGERKMFRVSDAGGELEMTEVAAEDDMSQDKLDGDDVFVINTGEHVYCWIGKGASPDERKNGMNYASNYLSLTRTPWLPISVVSQGKESAAFQRAF